MGVSKYIHVKKKIQERIISGEYMIGDKVPSESELIKEFKVSRHTIRRSIAELENEKYVIKKQGSGTYVSKGFMETSNSISNAIGVVTTYLSDYIFPSIIRGIEKELTKNNYTLMILSTHNNLDNERKILNTLIEKDIKGLIIEPTKSSQINPNLNYYTRIMQKKTPILMLHAKYDELNTPEISMNDVKAGFLATEYLIEKGHTKIMIITKTDDQQGKKRLKGFMQAHIDNNLTVNENHIITFETETVERLEEKIASSLNQETPPTGIVCYNDQIASTLIQKIQMNGQTVPGDFSVVSHDDSYLSKTIAGLDFTSIVHPKEEMGKQAARWIIDAVENPQIQYPSIVFEPKLKIGNTVKSI